MSMDWNALLRGFFWGLPVSALFFVGLAWGMRLALRSTQPATLLLLSAACRITALLAVGYWVSGVSGASASTNSAWPLVGYALAFFLVRLLAIARARMIPTTPEEGGA